MAGARATAAAAAAAAAVTVTVTGQARLARAMGGTGLSTTCFDGPSRHSDTASRHGDSDSDRHSVGPACEPAVPGQCLQLANSSCQ